MLFSTLHIYELTSQQKKNKLEQTSSEQENDFFRLSACSLHKWNKSHKERYFIYIYLSTFTVQLISLFLIVADHERRPDNELKPCHFI